MTQSKTINQVTETLFQRGADYQDNGQPEPAVRCFQLAADQAMAKNDFAEAISLFGRCLSLTPDSRPDQRYNLLLMRQKAYGKLGRRREQEQDLVSLSTLANTLNDDERQVEVAGHMAGYKLESGEYQDALTIAQLALRLADSIGIATNRVLLHQVWGNALVRLGDRAGAIARLNIALKNAEATRNFQGQADTLRFLGVVFINGGDHERARSHFLQAEALYDRIEEAAGKADVLNNLGNVAKMQGRIAEALKFWEDAREIYEALDDRKGLARLLVNLGAGCIDVGFYAEARRHCEAALTITREINMKYGEAVANLNLAMVHFYETAPRTAEINALAALELARGMGSRLLEGYALNILGRIYLLTEEIEQSLDALWQALALWKMIDQKNLEMETRAALIDTALFLNDLDGALPHAKMILAHLDSGGSLDGTASDLSIYLACYRALAREKNPKAAPLLTRANDLLNERAAGIRCPDTRASFLSNNKVHVAVTNIEPYSDDLAAEG